MSESEKILENLLQELRRGTQVLGVLSRLTVPRYGYALAQFMEEKGVPVEAGTLYPLLRRLEKQGILKSAWETSTGKPRKYYVLSQTGRTVLIRLREEWRSLAKSLDALLDSEGEE